MKKIFTTIIIIHFLLFTALAQDLEQTVSLNFTNTPLKEILNYISKTYSVEFFYGNDRVPLEQRVSIEVNRKPLSVAMDELFADQRIQYKLIENYIVLRKGNAIKQPIPDIYTPNNSTGKENEMVTDSDTISAANTDFILPDTLMNVSKKGFYQVDDLELREQKKIRNITSINPENDPTQENLIIGRKITYRIGPVVSYDRYHFKDPVNSDQTFNTEFNYSVGISTHLEIRRRITANLMMLYATRNFSLQYNFRILDLNDPVPIPDQTEVNLAYLDIPLLIHYHFAWHKRLKFSAAVGGITSFLLEKSEQTTFINNNSSEKTEIFFNDTNATLFGGILGLQVTYKVYPYMELSLMPNYQNYFNKINDQISGGNTRRWGINFALLFKI